MVIGLDAQLKKNIMHLWHDSPTGGYSSIEQTYRRISSLFYRKGIWEDVHIYVKDCDIYQRHKCIGGKIVSIRELMIC